MIEERRRGRDYCRERREDGGIDIRVSHFCNFGKLRASI